MQCVSCVIFILFLFFANSPLDLELLINLNIKVEIMAACKGIRTAVHMRTIK